MNDASLPLLLEMVCSHLSPATLLSEYIDEATRGHITNAVMKSVRVGAASNNGGSGGPPRRLLSEKLGEA